MAAVQFTVTGAAYQPGVNHDFHEVAGAKMGKEVKGGVRVANVRHTGKILLESAEIIFRGGEFRMRIPFAEIRSVSAANGDLRIVTKLQSVTFEVGSAAEKWRDKILHPKSRLDKLGVKPGTAIRVIGTFQPDFLQELKAGRPEILSGKSSHPADVTFLSVTAGSVSDIAKHARRLRGSAALWVVYLKGQNDLKETEVIAAGRDAGLKDVKVVGFSATHTALKFVIPVGRR